MIGYNEFGHPEFDTQRSALGELIYRLKYKGDIGTISSIVETAARFIREWGISLDVIIPVPPSKQRLMQPVFEIASALGSTLGIAVDTKSVSKTSSTSQMKDIGDYSARVVALESTIQVEGDLNGKRVLLVDDLFQSGASMNVVAQAIKDRGRAGAVHGHCAGLGALFEKFDSVDLHGAIVWLYRSMVSPSRRRVGLRHRREFSREHPC